MPTDIKLDEGDGNHVVIEGTVVRTTASDLILDAPARRRSGGLRRALVHDGNDGLTVNYNGDYPGGVTVGSDLIVAGDLTVAGEIRSESANGYVKNLREVIDRIEDIIRSLNSYYIENLETSLTSLGTLLDAAAVPPWKTLEEVENGDDMGILYMSAEKLGFHVEYEVFQGVPDGFQHGDVLNITPPPGTFLRKGSTVVVKVCLEG